MMALASLGGVVLAGVVAHGAWQAKKAGPKRATAPVREEPSASAPLAGTASDATRDDSAGIEPTFTPTRRLSKRLPLQIDALIDAVAPITLDAPMGGDALLAHLPSRRRVGSKLLLIEGLNAAS